MSKNLSSADLMQLSELLEAESVAYKKVKSFMPLVQDPVLREKLSGWANCHKTRFEKMYAFLNATN